MANPNPNPATRFKKGQSGNPKGRPKGGKSLTDILREVGEIEDVKHNGEIIARKTALAHKMWSLALQGKPEVMRYMYDRLDGKPTQEIKVNSDASIDAPIHLHVGATITVVDYDGSTEDEDDDGQ